MCKFELPKMALNCGPAMCSAEIAGHGRDNLFLYRFISQEQFLYYVKQKNALGSSTLNAMSTETIQYLSA